VSRCPLQLSSLSPYDSDSLGVRESKRARDRKRKKNKERAEEKKRKKVGEQIDDVKQHEMLNCTMCHRLLKTTPGRGRKERMLHI